MCVGINVKLIFLGPKKVIIDENFLSEHVKYDTMKSEMEKAVITLKNNYIKNLSLRSSTGIPLLMINIYNLLKY